MSVSNKVALWAILPAVGILLYGIASIFIYQPSIDARVSILSSIATSVTVLFLISERFRESARRKLDYVNKKALTSALGIAKQGVQGGGWDGNAKTLSQCRELLAHHGRFLRVKLYPQSFLDTLETARAALLTYMKPYQKILEIGYKTMGQAQFNIWAVLVIFGYMDKGNYNDQLLDPHRAFLDSLKKTEPKLVEEFPRECQKLRDSTRVLVEKIEAFFVDNQLEEFKEPNPFERGGLTF